MSGGVDSSVVAALLKQEGYDVIGMMLRLWSEENTCANRCCTPDSIEDARCIADLLEIPFYVRDYQLPFKEVVVDYFIDVYSKGMTPNPCLVCNKQIRFGKLLEEARNLGADYMATGHYVRVEKENDAYRLFKGEDDTKDQSYVLYQLDQKQLSHLMFPLGTMKKSNVRELAARFELPVAKRPDSQDLCFIGDEDYRGFLKRYAPQAFKTGDIINHQGETLGRHNGLPGYTIGQRRGLGVSASEPLYVTDLDMKNNNLIVGTKSERGRDSLIAGETRYISGKTPEKPIAITAKIRYSARPVPAKLIPLSDTEAKVLFEKPLADITPGQGVVFYNENEVIGGGIIQREDV